MVRLLALLALFVSTPALATKKPPPPPPPEPPVSTSEAFADASAEAIAGASGLGKANIDAETTLSVAPVTAQVDHTIDQDFSTENNSSNVVLVPNNNTETCLRVWGLAFGRNGESGALGVPWRSKKCDYEQAADDAFAGGERELGWFWKCQNRNLARQFRDQGEDWTKASADCTATMVGGVTAQNTIRKLKAEVAELEAAGTRSREEMERCRLREACRK